MLLHLLVMLLSKYVMPFFLVNLSLAAHCRQCAVCVRVGGEDRERQGGTDDNEE